MVARLGHVLYWLFSTAAGLWMMLVLYLGENDLRPELVRLKSGCRSLVDRLGVPIHSLGHRQHSSMLMSCRRLIEAGKAASVGDLVRFVGVALCPEPK